MNALLPPTVESNLRAVRRYGGEFAQPLLSLTDHDFRGHMTVAIGPRAARLRPTRLAPAQRAAPAGHVGPACGSFSAPALTGPVGGGSPPTGGVAQRAEVS